MKSFKRILKEQSIKNEEIDWKKYGIKEIKNEEEIWKYAGWFLFGVHQGDIKVKNAVVDIKNKKLLWKSGEWIKGTWEDGEWIKGKHSGKEQKVPPKEL